MIRLSEIVTASIILALMLVSCKSGDTVVPPDTSSHFIPSDSAKMHFLADATDYAIGYLFITSSPDTASLFIPDSILNIYLYPLGCLYDKRHQIALLDTLITQKQIHEEQIWCESLLLMLDTSFAWVKNIREGISPTGNGRIDSITRLCTLTFHYVFVLSSGLAYVSTMQSPVNNYALSKFFLSIPGVASAASQPQINYYSKLAMISSPSQMTVRFYYGYGDCPLGCFGYDRWTFTVNKAFDIEYQGYVHQ